MECLFEISLKNMSNLEKALNTYDMEKKSACDICIQSVSAQTHGSCSNALWLKGKQNKTTIKKILPALIRGIHSPL